jgi:hypothetical protein
MSTQALRAALRKRYAAKSWVVLEEVKNGAGHQANRAADAIAMNLWPSQGLELHGFELKASRDDWLRELREPAKADAFGAYCDRWWIVVSDTAIVVDGELPPSWGLLMLEHGALRTIKEAPKRDGVVAPCRREVRRDDPTGRGRRARESERRGHDRAPATGSGPRT